MAVTNYQLEDFLTRGRAQANAANSAGVSATAAGQAQTAARAGQAQANAASAAGARATSAGQAKTAATVGAFGTPTQTNPASTSVSGPMDYDNLFTRMTAETRRNNALRSKAATNQAEETAWRSGAKAGTEAYQNFIQRGQAQANLANVESNQNLQEFGANLQRDKRVEDRADMGQMLEMFDDNPEVKQQLYGKFLSGGDLADAYSGLYNEAGELKTVGKTAAERSVDEYANWLRATNPSLSDDEVQAQARTRAWDNFNVGDKAVTKDAQAEQEAGNVLTAVKSGQTVDRADLTNAIQSDPSILVQLRQNALSINNGDDLVRIAGTQNVVGKYVQTGDGNLYQVEGIQRGSDGHMYWKMYDVATGNSKLLKQSNGSVWR